jgi:hypothetical protein
MTYEDKGLTDAILSWYVELFNISVVTCLLQRLSFVVLSCTCLI